MKRRPQWWLAGILTIASIHSAAWAMSDVDILLNKLVEKGILNASEAQEVRNEMAPETAKRDEAVEKRFASLEKGDNKGAWKWKGDFRLRNEYRNRTGTGNDVNRQRIRFRYGFEAKPADDLTFGARLATGSITDPVSTNQSFDVGFNKKTIVLDRAYLAYTPEVPGLKQFKLVGGMFENPFWVNSPMVWDDDLNFDGVAWHADKDIGLMNVFVNGGVFAIDTDETEAEALWSAQVGAAIMPFKASDASFWNKMKLTAAFAYHDYVNTTTATKAGTDFGPASGNNTNLNVLKDFNLLNPSVELATEVAGFPVAIDGDWVHNTGAIDEQDGYLVGVKVGKAKEPWSLTKGWEAGYFFERLEDNAAFGRFVDSDFGGGGTNHRGHVFWLKLAAYKNSEIGLKYFTTEQLHGAKNHFDTFQADWVTKF